MGSDEEVQLKNNIISLFMQRFNDLEGAVDEASLLKTTVRDYLNIYNQTRMFVSYEFLISVDRSGIIVLQKS